MIRWISTCSYEIQSPPGNTTFKCVALTESFNVCVCSSGFELDDQIVQSSSVHEAQDAVKTFVEALM